MIEKIRQMEASFRQPNYRATYLLPSQYIRVLKKKCMNKISQNCFKNSRKGLSKYWQ
jgi:hypothetical protein